MKSTEIIEKKLKKIRTRKYYTQGVFKCSVLILALLVLVRCVIGYAVVEGSSMEPALQENDFVIYNRHPFNLSQGDVVAICMDNGEKYIKRIIGLPGDVISINEKGELLVNGEVLEEEYVYQNTYPMSTEVTYPLTVGEDELFVLGDHREVSKDSRTFGCVKKDTVIGRVFTHIRFGGG